MGFGFFELFHFQVDYPQTESANSVPRSKSRGSHHMRSGLVKPITVAIAPCKIPGQFPILLNHRQVILQEFDSVQPLLGVHYRLDLFAEGNGPSGFSHKGICYQREDAAMGAAALIVANANAARNGRMTFS